MSPLQQPLRVSLCVASGFFAFQLLHTFFIWTAKKGNGAAARKRRLGNTPSAVPTSCRDGALQPKVDDPPQRDH